VQIIDSACRKRRADHRKFGVLPLPKPEDFADHFFYQQNSVFGIHCPDQMAGSQPLPPMLRLAIELYFGDDKVVTIDFQKKPLKFKNEKLTADEQFE
jgi:hypothetical protein